MNLLELNLSPDYGGLEMHTRDFSRWLMTQADCHLYLVLQKDTRLDKALDELQVKSLRFTGKAGKLPFSMARELAHFIDKEQIDVVHVHWKNDLPLAALTKRLCKRSFKLVHTRQMNMPGKKKGLYHRYIYTSLDLFIAITDYLKQQAEENLPISGDKIRRIYYGVGLPDNVTPQRTMELKETFGIKEGFHVGLFGRIDEYKGQHLLVDAVEQLAHKGHSIHAWIIGDAFDPVYTEHLKQSVKDRGLENHVHFPGFYEKPIELMTCFDAVVLTTVNETFGLVLIEAMHAGVAVIGSNAGGVPEIIEHEQTGLLFESLNVNDLADQLQRLIEDDEFRRTLARAGQAKARETFDLQTQFAKFYEALMKICEM